MGKTIDEFLKQAKHLADEIDVEKYLNSIDFDKVDAKKLKKIDFSKGVESARHQLEQLPKIHVTTEPQKDDDGGFLGGVILGVVLGAILALIFAPRSGSETREMVASTVDDFKHKVTGETDEPVDPNTVIREAEAAVDEAFNNEPAIERNFG